MQCVNTLQKNKYERAKRGYLHKLQRQCAAAFAGPARTQMGQQHVGRACIYTSTVFRANAAAISAAAANVPAERLCKHTVSAAGKLRTAAVSAASPADVRSAAIPCTAVCTRSAAEEKKRRQNRCDCHSLCIRDKSTAFRNSNRFNLIVVPRQKD